MHVVRKRSIGVLRSSLASSTRTLSQTNGSTQVRTITRHNEPWWVLADVCKVLEIGNAPHAASRLDDDEKATIVNSDGQAGSGAQYYTIINESGLYSLILTSRSSVDHLWEVMAIIDGCNIQGEPSRDSWGAAFSFPCGQTT